MCFSAIAALPRGMFSAALAALLLAVAATFPPAPSRAEALDSEAFVSAFGEVCIPERLSYKGTLALAGNLGWRPVVTGENVEYDRFIVHSESLLAQEVSEDPDLVQGSGGAWFTREIGGRPHLLAVSYLLTDYLNSVGCYLYDFNATAPIDPEPVTRLLGHEIAYSSDGDDPLYAVDPELLISTVWGPPPRLPRTLDTYLTFIPRGSEVEAQTGFSGLLLKFSTSLPDLKEFQQ